MFTPPPDELLRSAPVVAPLDPDSLEADCLGQAALHPRSDGRGQLFSLSQFRREAAQRHDGDSHSASARLVPDHVPKPPALGVRRESVSSRGSSVARRTSHAISPGSAANAKPHSFQFTHKDNRQRLVHEALVSVGDIVAQEQLALAKEEGYQNFGEVLFGKNRKKAGVKLLRRRLSNSGTTQNQSQLRSAMKSDIGSPRTPRAHLHAARTTSQMSSSTASASGRSSLGTTTRALRLDNVQLQQTIERSTLQSISRKHLRHKSHPNHDKAVAVFSAITGSVELQDCIHDSVEFALLALTAALPDDVLHMPLPEALRIDFLARKKQEDERRAADLKVVKRSPRHGWASSAPLEGGVGDDDSVARGEVGIALGDTRADRALREERVRREQTLQVRTHPVQAACDRHGLWYSLMQPDAPVPPLHMKVPSRFRGSVASQARKSVLPTEHYFDMTRCNRHSAATNEVEQGKITRRPSDATEMTAPTPRSARHASSRGATRSAGRLLGDERLDEKLLAVGESYLQFLWSVEGVPFRDDIVGCVPHVVARAVRETIETRRSRAVANELASKEQAAKRRRQQRLGLVSDDDQSVDESPGALRPRAESLSTTTQQLGAASDAEGPLLVTDEDREQYRVRLMGRNQKLFDESMATVHRDLVWLFCGVDRRTNFAESAWITSGAGHSMETTDDAPGAESTAAAVKETALSAAVTKSVNMHDSSRPAPLFPWQLCSDGATSNRQFQQRMNAKVRNAEAKRKGATATMSSNASTLMPSPSGSPRSKPSSRGFSGYLRGGDVHGGSSATLLRHSSATTTNADLSLAGSIEIDSPRISNHASMRKARRKVFTDVDPQLHLRTLKSELASIRTGVTDGSSGGDGTEGSTGARNEAQLSVTARIVGKDKAETVDRLRTAVQNALPRARGPADIGLPHAQRVVASAQRDDQGRCEWFEQGRRFGPAMRHSEAPYGFFDLNTVSPLVSLQVRQSRQESGARGAKHHPQPPVGERTGGPDAAKPPRRSNLPHGQAHMRWLF